MAKDGRIYERSKILAWLSRKATSPVTREPMGTELTPVPLLRNTIEKLVSSGDIDGEISEAWTKKLAREEEVKEIRAKAEEGDGKAMHRIGLMYQEGLCGLAQDDVQARAWSERSAAVRYPQGMARFGDCLLNGYGGPQDIALGLDMIRQAAALGSDLAFYLLGWAFFHGDFGLSQDPVQARFWLEKIYGLAPGPLRKNFWEDLPNAARPDAARLLRELDQEE